MRAVLTAKGAYQNKNAMAMSTPWWARLLLVLVLPTKSLVGVSAFVSSSWVTFGRTSNSNDWRFFGTEKMPLCRSHFVPSRRRLLGGERIPYTSFHRASSDSEPSTSHPGFFGIEKTKNTTTTTTTTTSSSPTTTTTTKQFHSKVASAFGSQDYWEGFYQNSSQFSWYTGWDDLEPFLRELIPTTTTSTTTSSSSSPRILLPGVGNDVLLRDMYDAGYHHLTAFDYAPEGIERCREMLGPDRISNGTDQKDVQLFVGDARNLFQVPDAAFDVVLEKGTFDAIVQSGGGISEAERAVGLQSMYQAVGELARVLRPGGVLISISAICTERLEQCALLCDTEAWEVLRDGSLHVTDDGFASNNFDGTLLAWKKK